MKVDILGVKIDNVSMDEAVNKASSYISSSKMEVIFTPNSEIIMEAKDDLGFKNILNSASMLTPDGIGVVYGAKILKTPLKGRVAGFDLVCNLFESSSRQPFSVYLFGSKPGVARAAGDKITSLYAGVSIAGVCDGYFDQQKEQEIILDINNKKPDILLVCLGAPKQEKWIFNNRDKLPNMLMIGAGGSLDVFAGIAKRAPDIFIRLGLEWLYRLIKEPWRIKRMIKLPVFLLVLIGERFKKTKNY